MAVTFRIPHELAEARICGRAARANPFGAQCYENLNAWLCFTNEVEEWIGQNIKRKSGIRLRPYYGVTAEEIAASTFDRSAWWFPDLNGYQVTFLNDKDGLLFKMFWL